MATVAVGGQALYRRNPNQTNQTFLSTGDLYDITISRHDGYFTSRYYNNHNCFAHISYNKMLCTTCTISVKISQNYAELTRYEQV